ncbi:unnamed protein product [Cuscuta campestris]|uniref:Uncharacterized protein n=2 Tax=Cuscuta sect. Cleistogrammica TaxID=1824901 RepID=A0A484MIY9_9ASTE|nr:hypothetical protein DM860_015536 [Cuscuta australis]VFQ88775.1 unnamed protein product [Cuscuta campestris]
MSGRRFFSFLKRMPSTKSKIEESKAKIWGRRVVSGTLICVTGGVALSALQDLSIYHSCSSKALEKASKNKAIIESIGVPIVRGPWYNASLGVSHLRHSVSCSFPVSGPQGSGIIQLKAVCNGDDTWISFFWPCNWEILIMEALVHVPGKEEKQQTFRITVSDDVPPPTACVACTGLASKKTDSLDKK